MTEYLEIGGWFLAAVVAAYVISRAAGLAWYRSKSDYDRGFRK
jgi:ABC-type thiamin/hydroxymethylpyrimidine transport system permease subunit